MFGFISQRRRLHCRSPSALMPACATASAPSPLVPVVTHDHRSPGPGSDRAAAACVAVVVVGVHTYALHVLPHASGRAVFHARICHVLRRAGACYQRCRCVDASTWSGAPETLGRVSDAPRPQPTDLREGLRARCQAGCSAPQRPPCRRKSFRVLACCPLQHNNDRADLACCGTPASGYQPIARRITGTKRSEATLTMCFWGQLERRSPAPWRARMRSDRHNGRIHGQEGV